MREFWKLTALALSLASLTAGLSLLLFLPGNWVAEAIQHRWGGDDDWVWLMLPCGGVLGLVIGVRYRGRIWLHCASLAFGLGTMALFLWLSVPVRSEPGGLAGGIGAVISAWLRIMVLWVAGVSLVTAGIVTSLIAVYQRWRATNAP